MKVRMVQHAVGQGGLTCGTLEAGGKPLRWVYDCGSNQLDALAREIEIVAGGGDIDLLFLSHLDNDHVRGIDDLLSRVKVREVVLPYLNELTLVATLAREAGRGRLGGVFAEAVSDLPGWFGSRGVETVTLVGGRDDDEEGDGPIVPEVPEGGERGGDCSAEWTLDPEAVSELITSAAPRQDAGAHMQQVAPGAAVATTASNRKLNWALIPYVHVPPARLMKAFEDALEAEFGTPLDKQDIVRRAKDPMVRDKLRACYDALWLDHNLISMTLYTGPVIPSSVDIDWRSQRFLHNRHWKHWEKEVGGWMLTGDAHLDGLYRRRRFLKYYENYTTFVNVLMLPHHGSIHNHSREVLDAMPALWVGFAAAGRNGYGHPHEDVRDAVRAHRSAYFQQVDEKQSSQLEMTVTL